MLNSLPPVTRALLIANVAVFLAEMLLGDALFAWFALWPLEDRGGFLPWQVVSYGFLHSGVAHLLINMLAVYMFGGDLERTWGSKRYTQLYFASIVTAALTQLLFHAFTNAPPAPTVGASGGVFGLLLAFAIYFPRRIIMPLIPPIPMPAPIFVALYGALELYMGVTGSMDGVAHFAHLGGMLGAWLMIQYWRGRPPFARN
jgi:membrane associated rhomboid family serine protease